MKKSYLTIVCYCIITCFLTIFLSFVNPFSHNLKAATVSQETEIKHLQSIANNITLQLNSLQSDLSESKKILQQCQDRLTQLENKSDTVENLLIDYYMDKLKDPTFTSIYNNEYIYYTAAEQLGQIGKKAIPRLIDRLDTTDDYERALVLYALLLASQDNEVKAFVDDNYLHTYLDFDARNHPQQVKVALEWWEKYKSYF